MDISCNGAKMYLVIFVFLICVTDSMFFFLFLFLFVLKLDRKFQGAVFILLLEVFYFILTSGGWVKIKLKLPHFHVSDTCVPIYPKLPLQQQLALLLPGS